MRHDRTSHDSRRYETLWDVMWHDETWWGRVTSRQTTYEAVSDVTCGHVWGDISHVTHDRIRWYKLMI